MEKARSEVGITWIGLGTALITTLLFYFWSSSLPTTPALGWSLALAGTTQLGIWWLTLKTKSFPLALLIVFGLYFPISFLPFAREILLILFFVFGFFFLQETRRAMPKDWKFWGTLLLFSVLYSFSIFESLERNVGDPLVEEKVRQLTLNPDTLFHAVMAEMIKNFGVISTGMHGLVQVHYHFLSHFLYGTTSRLLRLTVTEVYGITNFLVFASVMITCLLRFLSSLTKSESNILPLINFVLFSCVCSRFFGWYFNNHFISESYLVGLIFLAPALVLLYQFVRESEFTLRDWTLLWLLLPLITIAKISTGAMLVAALGVALIFKNTLKWSQKIVFGLLSILTWGIGYKLARTLPIKGLEVKWAWGWFQEKVLGESSFLKFLLITFPIFFLLLPALWIFLRRSRSQARSIEILILLAVVFIGFLGLNLTIDSSGAYFSALYVFFAFPILLRVLQTEPANQDISPRYQKGIRVVLVLSMIAFFFHFLPAGYRGARDIRDDVQGQIQNPDNYYLLKLKEIRNLNQRDYFVYIPRSEKAFWKDNSDPYSPWKGFQCIRIPFYIPLISGQPAIYGLPEAMPKCYTFHRGYEAYEPSDFDQSQIPDISKEQLCEETLKRGGQGYFRVTQDSGIETHPCQRAGNQSQTM